MVFEIDINMPMAEQNPDHLQTSIFCDSVKHRVVRRDRIFVDFQVLVLLHQESKVLGGRTGDGCGDGKGN